jgi:hypothetical protein
MQLLFAAVYQGADIVCWRRGATRDLMCDATFICVKAVAVLLYSCATVSAGS